MDWQPAPGARWLPTPRELVVALLGATITVDREVREWRKVLTERESTDREEVKR
jgi:hypothetical protein